MNSELERAWVCVRVHEHSSTGIILKHVCKICTYVWICFKAVMQQMYGCMCDRLVSVNVKHTRCAGVCIYSV